MQDLGDSRAWLPSSFVCYATLPNFACTHYLATLAHASKRAEAVRETDNLDGTELGLELGLELKTGAHPTSILYLGIKVSR